MCAIEREDDIPDDEVKCDQLAVNVVTRPYAHVRSL